MSNKGILTAKTLNDIKPEEWKRLTNYNGPIIMIEEDEVIMVPLWKCISVTAALLLMTATFVYSVRPSPEPVVQKVMVPQACPNATPYAVIPPINKIKDRATIKGWASMLASAAAVPVSNLNARVGK